MNILKIAVAAASYAIDKPYHYRAPEGQALQPGQRVLVPFGRGNRRSEGLILAIEESEELSPAKAKNILAVLDEQPVLDAAGLRLLLWLRERYFASAYQVLRAMLPTGLLYTLRDRYRLSPAVTQEQALAAAGKSRAARALLEQLFALGGEAELAQLLEAPEHKNPQAVLRRLVDEGLLHYETGTERKIKDKTEQLASLQLPPREALALAEKRRNAAPARYAVVELLCGIGTATVKELCYFTGVSRSALRAMEKSGLLRFHEQEVFRRAIPESYLPAAPLQLNQEQEQAAEELLALADSPSAEAALLHGVTGSGKTQVYLRVIDHVLAQGKGALLLVPEIALTAKLLEIFVSHFGENVAILHSALPAGERYDEWKRIRRGQARVVLGTRSAVFAPLQNLGLVILDEEHEGSFQSETMLRYHAREVAKYRCVQHAALLLLGSATPAIESMQAAREGRYHLFTLRERFNARPLPEVTLVDMKKELQAGNNTPLSAQLCQELEANFASGEQSILFLNRRGSHRMVACGLCGEAPTCPRCTAYLTYHGANGRLMCHHCGHASPLPSACPQCGGGLHFIGNGTQQVEQALRARYPDIEALRMDADTLSARQSHEVMLERFSRKKIPVLIGTQMVAKGLDFPNVTLVGVIDADLGLYAPSLRASERSFSLITQVVGRAGRGERTGRALIQTMTPENETLVLAAKQDYDSFFERELALRRLRSLPPFSDEVLLSVSGADEAAVLRICMNLRQGLARCLVGDDALGTLLGPAPASVLKVNNRYRYQLSLHTRSTKLLRAQVASLLRLAQADPATRGMSIMADLNFMD